MLSIRKRTILLMAAICAIASAQTRTRDPNKLETLTVQMREHGFLQKNFEVPQGYYYLVAINHSGMRDLHLRLEQMPGNSVVGTATQELFTGQGKPQTPRVAQTVKLTPGTYRLSVLERAAWVVQIDVQ